MKEKEGEGDTCEWVHTSRCEKLKLAAGVDPQGFCRQLSFLNFSRETGFALTRATALAIPAGISSPSSM